MIKPDKDGNMKDKKDRKFPPGFLAPTGAFMGGYSGVTGKAAERPKKPVYMRAAQARLKRK